MNRKRNEREVYLGAAAFVVLVFILGLIIVGRVAQEQIAAYEARREAVEKITPSPTQESGEIAAATTPARLLEPSASAAAVTMPEPTLTPEPVKISRYAGIELAAGDFETLARLVWLEARGEPFEGQVAVVEVVLNRILSPSFPDTVEEVVYQTGPVQFSPAKYIPTTTPTETQYEAVETALHAAEPITDADVVYFSTEAQNSRVFAVIGNHVFCRE